MKKQFKEFLIFTAIPFILPTLASFVEASPYEEILWTIAVMGMVIDCVFAFKFYKKYDNARLKTISDFINKESYLNAIELCNKKRDYIINKTYADEYRLEDKDIPYNVHDYIAEICKSFCDTISKITDIDKRYISVTFIYRYVYDVEKKDYSNWKWIVGKEGTTTIQLEKFVEYEETLYHYLINGDKDNKVDFFFDNQKGSLGHYFMSKRDISHNKKGSIFGANVMFGNNAKHLVEGILIVSTYGKQFVKQDETKYNENELRNLMFEELFPYYQRLLETELGMLYLRHKER